MYASLSAVKGPSALTIYVNLSPFNSTNLNPVSSCVESTILVGKFHLLSTVHPAPLLIHVSLSILSAFDMSIRPSLFKSTNLTPKSVPVPNLASDGTAHVESSDQPLVTFMYSKVVGGIVVVPSLPNIVIEERKLLELPSKIV